jgi:ssDNA-binding Zn-finger/Zn-ribbon topoisomerase 1
MSQGTAVWLTVTITPMTCPTCGVVYGINEEVRARKNREGGNWHCTNGHSIVYTEPEIEQLRKQLEAERRRVANLRDEANVAYAGKAAAERKVKRMERGTCPHCNRHFVNVERHMKTKHSDRG